MQTQLNQSFASDFNDLPGAAIQKHCDAPADAGQQPSYDSNQLLSVTKSPLFVDWNLHHPDGADASLQGLVREFGVRLAAEVTLGKTLPGGGVAQLISSKLGGAQEQPTLALVAGIVEASLAKQSLLVATAENHNSGVLNFLRQNTDLRVVVGFAVWLRVNPLEAPYGLLICQSNGHEVDASSLARLPLLQREFMDWMQVWHACRHASDQHKWTVITARLKKHRRAWTAGLMAVAMALVFVPFPYWPQRECVVEPSAKRFVASPIEGRFLQSQVRPGDVVTAGQTIGQLDDEPLRWELGAAEAELQAAQKHRDSALANKEGGKLRLAQFEQQQIALKIQSLQSQLQQLELRSPIDGIVLQGDWFRSQGAPVARGDTLFEIAPLEHMTVEVHLKTEDLGEISVGDLATLRVDSAVGNSWTGSISRLDPRAAVIDDQVCFVADVEVDNSENRLRPGMQGTVRISTGYKSLGWLIFHRPYRWLMKNLAW